MLLGVVDHRALEVGGEDVAHDAHRQVGLLEDERRRMALGHALLQHLAELEQVDELALQVGALGPLGGGADDRSPALELEPGRLLAQPLALLLVQAPRDADALAVGGVDHVAPGDREVHRQARALGLERVLDHLDHDLLAGLEQIGDVASVTRPPAAAARRLDAGEHDLVDVQEAVLLQADVDERGLESGQDVVDPTLVDVADDRAVAPTLQVELGDRVLVGSRRLTPVPGAGARTGFVRRDRSGRLQHRDAGLPAVHADQHLLLQLSSILWKSLRAADRSGARHLRK